jgi:hypothetical protein
MRIIIRPLLVAATTLLSVTQVIWMGALLADSIDGFWRIGELDYGLFLILVAWWTGFASAMAFARRALSKKRGSRWHFAGVAVGLLAAILFETRMSDPAFNAPYGPLELAILSWVGLGFLAPCVTRSGIASDDNSSPSS